MKTFFVLIILCYSSFYIGQNSWVPLGQDDFNQPSFGKLDFSNICIDNSNGIYIAYSDNTISDGVTVRKYVNQSWSVVGDTNASNTPSSFVSMALNSSGTPFIAYQNSSNGNKLEVKKFDGSNWVLVGSAGVSDGQASDITIAIGQNDIPYVAYKDNSQGNKASVQMFDGTSWQIVGTLGISTNQANYLSLTIINNQPYIAYSNPTVLDKATVQMFDGSSWINVGNIGVTNGQSEYTVINSDNSGTPYLLYRDGANSNKATMIKYDGSGWVTIGTSGFTSFASKNLWFDFDSNDVPYVIQTYDNNGLFSLYKYDNSAWNIVGNNYIINGAAENCKVVLDNNDAPIIIYNDIDDFGGCAVVKKFDNNSWVTVGDSSITSYTRKIKTSMDDNGIVYVLHQQFFTDELTVVKYSQGNWTQVGSSIGIVRNDAVSLGIDDNNDVFVAFSDDNNGGRIKVKKFDNGSWTNISTSGLTTNSIYTASIAFDSNNDMHLGCKESTSNYWIEKFDGSTWVPVADISLNVYDAQIKIDRNNIPNIIYLSYKNSSNYPSAIRYISPNWDLTPSSVSYDFGYDISLEISNNIPYVTYVDGGDNSTVKVKYYDGSNWTELGNLSSPSNISAQPSLKFNNNELYVTYVGGATNVSATDRNISVYRYNGMDWELVGTPNVNSGKGYYPHLEFWNDTVMVIYSGDNGCFAKYNDPSIIAANIDNDISIEKDYITIYPNPTSGLVFLNSIETIEKIELYNIQGDLLLIKKDNLNELNLKEYENGLYLLNVFIEEEVSTIKIIKNY